MDSTLGSFSHNYTTYEEPNDSLSVAVNRSRKLLDETIANNLNVTSSATSRLFKSSLNTTNFQNISNLNTTTTTLSEQAEQSSIFTQFKIETNKNVDEDLNIVNLIKSYSSICSEHSFFLKEKLQHISINRQKDLYNTTLNDQEELDKEKHIWNLICMLYEDEENMKKDEENENMDMGEMNHMEKICESALVKNLERKNSFLRRIKLIINWLEKIASESNHLKLVKEKMSAFQLKCSGWEHTLHYLKNLNTFQRKEKIQMSGRDFVSELDPDAPIRQNKPLHDLDQEDEFKLMEYIFAFIRAGDLDSARDFCFKVGQSWRAATLEGFKFYNDENYFNDSTFTLNNRQQTQQVFKNEGNLNRDLWRLMVQKLIKDEHFGVYEKAVYASLAGFVNPVIPVCRNYLDIVWIYLKALYNHIIEKEIRQKITIREFVNIPYDTDEDNLFGSLNKVSSQNAMQVLSLIFERIKILINNSGNNLVNGGGIGDFGGNLSAMSSQVVTNLKQDAQKPSSIILKHIILSGINGFQSVTNELMDYLKTAVSTDKQNGSLLRFSAHLSLFYRSASIHLKNDTFIQINDNYVEYLIEHKYKEIIAYYLSQLPSEIQTNRYSKFLQTITDNKERILLLNLAKERNMNVQAITLNIVDNLSRQSLTKSQSTNSKLPLDQTTSGAFSTTMIVNKMTDMLTSRTTQVLNDEDKSRISALDWIVYDQLQRFKLLEYGNLTMRYFLLERQNLEATKNIFVKIPQDTLTIILNQYNFNSSHVGGQLNTEGGLQQIIDNLPNNVANSIKEYLGFKEYIEAINLYNEWFEYYHREKPVKPQPKLDKDSGTQEQTFAERMAYDYQLKQYEDLSSRWYSKALLYSEKVKAKFFAVLKFPFGGWMCEIKNCTDVADMIDDDDKDEEVLSDENNENYISDDGEESDQIMNSDEVYESKKEKKAKANALKKSKEKELHGLRKIYLPNICFILLDMFHKMNLNKELIRLSDLVASENYKLYSLFDAHQLKCFINKIADASISLLDSNMDYLAKRLFEHAEARRSRRRGTEHDNTSNDATILLSDECSNGNGQDLNKSIMDSAKSSKRKVDDGNFGDNDKDSENEAAARDWYESCAIKRSIFHDKNYDSFSLAVFEMEE